MKIIWIIFTLLILLINQVNACAPFTSELIVVWEYNWLLENKIPDEKQAKWEFKFMDFINTEKIFSKYNLELGKHYFVDTDRINLSGFDKWDKIIAISDYDNGDFEDYYTIYEMWKLSCNNENKLNIENRQWYFKAFWKKIWNCWEIPDYILSEEEILEKIQNTYKLCEDKILIEDVMEENFREVTINKTIENTSVNIDNNILWYTKILQWIINFFKNIFS